MGVLAPDGYCRPFDIDATGYTRSEAVCLIFLQKAKDAKRIYSTVVYSKTNCDGELAILHFSFKTFAQSIVWDLFIWISILIITTGYKPEGITYPSGAMQQKLLSEFYDEVKIDPSTLAYVEAHR